MATLSLPFSQFVAIETSVAANAASGPTYNTGCIVGPTRIVPTSGAPARVTPYASTSAMIAAGYSATSPEVIAAGLYFNSSPPPPVVYIGLQNPTAIGTMTVSVGGTDYVVGDVLSVSQSGAQGGELKVTTVGANGAITGFVQVQGGDGYSVATNLPTTGGTGSGAEVSISAIGETPLQAVTACRAASSAFYGISVCGAVKADNLAIMAFCESATPDTFFFANTADADSIAASSTSLIGEANAAAYENSLISVSTTQSGAYPSNAYFGADVMGLALGMFTGLAGSYFTLNAKTLAGVYPEPLTLAQQNAIVALNANVYGSYAYNAYKLFRPGVTPSGTFFDQVIFTKAFQSDLQYAMANVLVQNKAVPQTDIGEELFLNAAVSVCQKYVGIGWIAPGVYTGATILSLASGQSLPKGYYVQADTYANQSPADQAARKAMPVYVTVKLANAVHFLTVAVSINL